MKKKPVVSAIVTTYKREPEVVGRALRSVVAQTYENMEILLVNDFPEDKELSAQLQTLCNSFKRKVLYLPMQKNSGANAARNYGASIASGEFIGFLDDDDEWDEKKIDYQIRAMKSEKIGIVYCNTWVNSEKYHNISIHYKSERPEGSVFSRLFHDNIIGSTSFPLIRKSAFDEVGGFDERVPALQDMELWLRITKKYQVKYIHEPLGTYYFYLGDRISAHSERRIKGYEVICEKHKEYLSSHKRAKADFDRMGITLFVNSRNFSKALSLWLEAVWFNPTNIKENVYMLIKIVIRIFIKAKIV